MGLKGGVPAQLLLTGCVLEVFPHDTSLPYSNAMPESRERSGRPRAVRTFSHGVHEHSLSVKPLSQPPGKQLICCPQQMNAQVVRRMSHRHAPCGMMDAREKRGLPGATLRRSEANLRARPFRRGAESDVRLAPRSGNGKQNQWLARNANIWGTPETRPFHRI